LTDLEDFHSGLRGALTEHLEQHTQQLGVLHVGGHHHPCALNHLQATTGLTRQRGRQLFQYQYVYFNPELSILQQKTTLRNAWGQ